MTPAGDLPPISVQLLLDTLVDGYIIIDELGRVRAVNRQLTQLLGYTADEILTLGIEDLVPEEHRPARSMTAEQGLAIRHENGSLIPVDVSLSPLTLEGHAFVVAAVRDARERIEREKARANLESMSRKLFLRNAAGAFRVTLEGKLLECNESLARMLGYESPEELQSVPAGSHHVDPASRQAWLDRLRETGVAMNYELQMHRKDGTAMWALENAVLVDDPTWGGPVVMGTVIDMSKQKEQQRQLEELAQHDFLTGLPNRRLLEERAEHVLALAERRGGKAAVVSCDLRRFKPINDTWGHKTGDEVLRQVAARLTANSRAEDTVVRLGGDEFAILLPDVRDERDALSSATRLSGFLDEPFEVGEQSFQLGASFGVAIYPTDGANIDELLASADHAMYSTRTEELKEVQLYSAVATEGRDAMLDREAELRRALAQEELVLLYQPIIQLDTGVVTGAEGLVRWNHPTKGLLPASEFVQLAEYTGLIAELDHWVLGAAVRDLGEWDESTGLEWVFLNLSAGTIGHPEFVSRTMAAIEEAGVDGGRLVLEITERAVMRDARAVGALLCALGEAGVRVALDDFGVGHSALSLLRDLPVQYLKVDGSFMPEVMRDGNSKALVLGIIGLAHGLGLQVIAEGVETPRQHEWLASVGCDYAQGWWTGHPVPSSELLSTPRIAHRTSATVI